MIILASFFSRYWFNKKYDFVSAGKVVDVATTCAALPTAAIARPAWSWTWTHECCHVIGWWTEKGHRVVEAKRTGVFIAVVKCCCTGGVMWRVIADRIVVVIVRLVKLCRDNLLWGIARCGEKWHRWQNVDFKYGMRKFKVKVNFQIWYERLLSTMNFKFLRTFDGG